MENDFQMEGIIDNNEKNFGEFLQKMKSYGKN
jgi:hypothetical protein